MTADIRISVKRITSPGSTGNQTYSDATIFGGQTPKAIMIFGGGSNGGDTTETGDLREICGFAVNGGNTNMHCTDAHNAGSSTSNSSRWNASSVIRLANGGTAFFVANVASWSANSVTIDWTTTVGAGAEFILVMLGGADLTAATDILNPSGTNPTVTPSFGFSADLVLFKSCVMNAAADTNVFQHMWAWGAATKDGTNKCVQQCEPDSHSGRFPSGRFSDNACINWMNASTGVTGWTAACSNFTATGFDFVVTGAPGGDSIAYLALNLGGGQAKLFDFTTPTTTGNLAQTGFGFQPIAGFIAGSSQTAANTDQNDTTTASAIALCVFNSTQQFGHSAYINHAASSNGASQLAPPRAACIGTESDADATRATLTSLDTDGWTLNWDQVSGIANKMWGLAITDVGAIPPTSERITELYFPMLYNLADLPNRITAMDMVTLYNTDVTVRLTDLYMVVLRAGIGRRRRIFPNITHTVSSPLIEPPG